MANSFDTAYPSVDDLRSKAKKRVPAFAFEYLDGGCNEDVSIQRNTSEIRDTATATLPQQLWTKFDKDQSTWDGI